METGETEQTETKENNRTRRETLSEGNRKKVKDERRLES